MLPIIKGDEFFALDGQESASEDALILEVSLERFVLAEVLVDLNCAIISFDCIDVLVQID